MKLTIKITQKILLIIILCLIIGLLTFEFKITYNDFNTHVKPLSFNKFLMSTFILNALLFIYGYITLALLKESAIKNLYIVPIAGFITLMLTCMTLATFKLLEKTVIEVMNIILVAGVTAYYILRFRHNLRSIIRSFSDLQNVVLFLATTYILLHFSRIAYSLNVAPPGDAFTHGMLASLIYFDKGLPETYYPILNCSFIAMPLNVLRIMFPLFTAWIATVMNTYVIHAIVIAAVLISQLIILVPLFYVYNKSHNVLSSVIIMLLMLIVPYGRITPPFSNNDPTLSNLINGTYPQHLANFLIMAAVLLYNEENIKHRNILLTLIAFELILVTPRAIPLIILYILIISFKTNYFKKLANRTTILLFIILMGLLLYSALLTNFIHFIVYSLISKLNINVMSSYIGPNQLFSNRLYHLIIITSALLTIVCRYSRFRSLDNLDRFLIVLFTIVVLSVVEPLHKTLLWIFSPSRTFLLTYMLALVSLCKNAFTLRFSSLRKNSAHAIYIYTLIMILLIFQVKGLLFNVTYTSPSWMRCYNPAYKAITVLLNVSKPNDVILDDPNWIGYSIVLFRPQNITIERTFFIMFMNKDTPYAHWYLRRVRDSINILRNPMNKTLFTYLIRKYKIKFIFLSQFNAFYNYFTGRYEYKSPRITYKRYLALFDSNPCLKVIFAEDNVRVYMVRTSMCENNG